MTNPQQVSDLAASTAFDVEGDKIGKVGQVYLNDETGDAEWITVHTGLFGTRESFAPLHGAQGGEDEVQLAVTKQQVKDAPHISADGSLEGTDVDALYQHYAGYTGREPAPGTAGDAGPHAGERLHPGTDSVPARRVRLQKHVVAEIVTVSDDKVPPTPVPDSAADPAAPLGER